MAVVTTREDIERAAERVAKYIRRTPVVALGPIISDVWDLVLKLDHLQPTGSFKVRGAFNLLLNNDVDRGVVAASGGNFGKAVAYAASRLGVPATIFVPETSPKEKTGAIAQYGADVHIIPGYYDDARLASEEFAEKSGLFLAHAYDHPDVVAGQGTVGREIAEQVLEVTKVLVPVGGGGLIGGVANWFRGDAEVFGVEPEGCPSLHEARASGQPVKAGVFGVASSSLGAEMIGEHPWLANQWIHDSVLVSEESILVGQRWFWDHVRLWVEPAASVTIAAIQTGVVKPEAGDTVVALVSGANVALEQPDIAT